MCSSAVRLNIVVKHFKRCSCIQIKHDPLLHTCHNIDTGPAPQISVTIHRRIDISNTALVVSSKYCRSIESVWSRILKVKVKWECALRQSLVSMPHILIAAPWCTQFIYSIITQLIYIFARESIEIFFSSHFVFIPLGVLSLDCGRGGGGRNHDAGSTSWCLSAIGDGRWHRLSAQPYI